MGFASLAAITLTGDVDSAKLPRMPAARVVLVRPQHAGNVGACARVVKNTGLVGLDLVRPSDWRTVEAWRTAWDAHEVLEQARVFDDLPSALRESRRSIALSGQRAGAWMDVRAAAEDLARLDDDAEASLVFGPEASGLTRDELALCGGRAAIPAHPEQPSLNLSHAVMVAAYELYRATAQPGNRATLATHGRKQEMLSVLLEGLSTVGALPEQNAESFVRDWTALVGRVDLTNRETQLLEHMSRMMVRSGRREPP